MLQTVTTGCEIDAHLRLKISNNQTVCRAKKYTEKALKPRCFKAFCMAGAEGLEPSARGFGADVETHKPLI